MASGGITVDVGQKCQCTIPACTPEGRLPRAFWGPVVLVGYVGVVAVVRYHYPEFRAVTWVSWVYLTYTAAAGVYGMWDVDDWPRDGRAALALGFVLVAASYAMYKAAAVLGGTTPS